jgi:UDP-N-acetylmuramyl pentapeptide synthase
MMRSRALQPACASRLHNWGEAGVAITGSAGKTTAKELTAHVLKECWPSRFEERAANYNNGLGIAAVSVAHGLAKDAFTGSV